MDQSSKVWIILGAILGSLVLSAVAVAVLFSWQRNKRRLRLRGRGRGRGFSLRPATPLDDAEFESWRRPSQSAYYSEKYGIRPARAAVATDRVSSELLEKELGAYEFGQSSNTKFATLTQSPMSPLQKPQRVRRKSSVASSLADRPPTPYSPTSPSSDFLRGSMSSRKSQPLIHYPSMSEASAFQFEFESEYGRKGSVGWI